MMAPMRIADFALERYFARWEFAVDHLLCASDVQGYPMAELLALADDDTRRMWDGLTLGYTESTGHPLLRAEIASLYEDLEPDDVLVFAGAEEAIFCLANVLLSPGDHAVVTWPGYQSLYEVARAAGADASPRGISLGVMSKSFAMAGLRIGWLATRDRDVLERCARFKDYTTICSSAPSEVLALIGLRARETVLARSRSIVADNLVALDTFFDAWSDRFTWVRPRAGSVGFPRLTVPGVSIDAWAAGLVEAEGVLLLPGSQFDYGGNHFRLGFGRADLPIALERLERHAERTLR